MRIHRLPSLALALLVLAAACGGGAADSAQDAASGQEAASGQGGGEGSGELVVWHYYDEGAGGLAETIVEWEQAFEASHPDVDVRLEYQPYDQMTQKVITAAAAGRGPDVVLPTHPFLPEMVKAGALLPLGEYWDSYADTAQFPAEVEDALVIDGERYAVQGFANVVGLYYNQAILDEIGAEVPTDVASLEEAMAAAQEAGYTALTTSAPAGAGGEFWAVPWLVSAGWSYDQPDDPGAEEILTRLADWRQQGFISESDATGFNSGQNFSTGDYLFAQDGNWNLSTYAEEVDFDYGVLVIPLAERAAIGGEVGAIGSGAEDPDLAWSFIEESLLSPEGVSAAAQTGSVPLRTDVVEDAAADDENLQAFSEIAAQSVGIPLDENTPQRSEAIGGAYNELIAGTIDGTEAAERIATELQALQGEG